MFLNIISMVEKEKIGRITVISGCVSSGKSAELVDFHESEVANDKETIVFVPNVSSHYSEVTDMNGRSIEAVGINPSNPNEILTHVEEEDSVFIDDGQFFFRKANEFVEVCRNLSESGVDVFVSGLDEDHLGDEFESISKLMVEGEEVVKCTTECSYKNCNSEATKSQKYVEGIPSTSVDDPIIDIGVDSYEPRCRLHHTSN